MKYLAYNNLDAKLYFWRTTQQQEIDLVEEHEGGQMQAYEFKWSKTGKARFPTTFTSHYPGVTTTVVSPENIEEFVMAGS